MALALVSPSTPASAAPVEVAGAIGKILAEPPEALIGGAALNLGATDIGGAERIASYATLKALADPGAAAALRGFIRSSPAFGAEARVKALARLDELTRRAEATPDVSRSATRALADFESSLPVPGRGAEDEPRAVMAALDDLFSGRTSARPPVTAELALGADGRWRPSWGDGTAALDASSAAQAIRDRGVDLRAERILIVGRPGEAGGGSVLRRTDGALELGADFLERLRGAAVAQGVSLEDKLVHALLAAQLHRGPSRWLNWTQRQMAEAAFGLENGLSADDAVAFFKRAWHRNEQAALEGLSALASAATPRVDGRYFIPEAVLGRAPGWFGAVWLPNVPVVPTWVDETGRGDALEELSGLRLPAFIAAIDVKARRLVSGEGAGRLEVRRIGADGPESFPIQTLHLTGGDAFVDVVLDPESGALLTLGSRGLERRRRLDDGSFEAEPAQSLDLGGPATGAFDPATRTLYVLGEGRLEARAVAPDGAVATAPKQRLGWRWTRPAFLLIDSKRGILIAVDGVNLRFWNRRADGTLDEKPYRSERRVPAVNSAVVDESAGRLLLAFRGGTFGSLPLPATSEEINAGLGNAAERETIADAVARRLRLGLPDEGSKAVIESLKVAGDGSLLGGVFRRLASDSGDRPRTSLRPVAGEARWFPGAEAALRRRMPTLWAALSEPVRLAGLLHALSVLRLAHPFGGSNMSPDTPIAWAKADGALYRLNELTFVPVSESFRRHIAYVEDAEGRFAVELKMPGELPDRLNVHEEHFTVARDLWEHFPEDPGVLKPLHFNRYIGSGRLYHRRLRFKSDAPLGVMVFEHQEGKRLRNAGPEFLARLGARDDARLLTLHLGIMADVAAAMIRLHRLGWSGSLQKDSDLHNENVTLLTTGRAVLSGDFGTFERARLHMRERSLETLRILGSMGFLLPQAYPMVVERLTRGKTAPALRRELIKEAAEELGLSSPGFPGGAAKP